MGQATNECCTNAHRRPTSRSPRPPRSPAGNAQTRWAIVLTVLGGVPFAVNFLLPHLVALLAVVAFGVGLVGMGAALWRSPVAT